MLRIRGGWIVRWLRPAVGTVLDGVVKPVRCLLGALPRSTKS
jgi:hypothetical protein